MKKLTVIILGIFLSAGLLAQDIKSINLKTNDLIYVPSIDKIVVSVLANEINGNSICFIDPYHGKIEDCYFIGGSPNKLAISNDGDLLYIALDVLPQIVTFDIISKSIESSFDLGKDVFNVDLFAEDIAVIPGEINSIVVSRKKPGSPMHSGIAVFDAGVIRPLTTPSTYGSNSLAYSSSNGRLFGINNETSEFGISEILINEEGASIKSVTNGLISGYGSVIKNEGRYLYSSQGERIYIDYSVPQLVGRYPLNTWSRTLLLPAPDSNVVYGIKGEFGRDFKLLTFNKTSYIQSNSIDIPYVKGELQDIIDWGTNGKIAFSTDETLTIIRNCTSMITDSLILSSDTLGACWGDTITLTAPDGYSKYYWSNGANTQAINLTNEGEFYFYTADSLGCLSAHSNKVFVEFDYKPHTPYIYSNDHSPLCKGQVRTLSTISAHAYLWSTGETSQEINVDKSGIYTVFSFSNPGCKSMESLPFVLNIIDFEIPDKPVIDVHGETEFCNGGSVILSIEDDYDIIQWTGGGNTNSIEAFNWSNYRVRVGHVMECLSVYSDPVSVRAIPIPPPPHILSNGNLLASSATFGNQWFHNGNAIQNANQQFYHATENGFYSVQVTIEGCTSSMSFLYNHYVVSTYENSENPDIKIFPNPTNDQIHFTFGDKITHYFDAIEVFDFTGNSILRAHNANSISLSNIPNGMYFVRVLDKSGAIIKTESISKM